MSETDTADDDFLWEERKEVLCRIELSARYHRKRERFFALSDRFSKAVSLIAGTAAFSSLLDTAEQKSIAGLIVALGSMPALVMAWSDKARLHADLAQKFLALEAEIAGVGKRGYTEDQINKWNEKVLTIEAGEPPTLNALVAICHNQMVIAKNECHRCVEVGFWKHLLCHIFDFEIDWTPRNTPIKEAASVATSAIDKG